jgi:hypothetical protein
MCGALLLGVGKWFVFWQALYLFLRTVVNPRLFTVYTTLDASEKSYWTASMISSIMAVVVCCTAFQTIDELDAANEFFTKSATSTKTIYIFMGYLMSDLVLSLIYMSSWPRWQVIILHHIVGLVSMGDIVTGNFGHGIAMQMMATEVTAPFVNMIYFLTTSGMKSTPLYAVNGFIAVVLYFPFRVLNMTWIAWRCYVMRDQIRLIPVLSINIIAWCWTVTYILQLVWFRKIALGALKLLKQKIK